MQPEDVAETLTELHAAGVIRRVGVSNMAATQIEAIQRHLDIPVDVNQLELSLAKRDWIDAGICVNGDHTIRPAFPWGTLEHCDRAGLALQSWDSRSRRLYGVAA